MYRIDNATATGTLPTPAAPGPNPDGYFTDGNPSLAVPATVVDADWLNTVQEEISGVIEGAGDTLDKTDPNQLLAAINALIAAAAVSAQCMHVTEQQTAGTDGGTFTSGSWQTRPLNTSVSNTIGSASLGSNQITLPAGTYEIDATAGAFNVGSHVAKLYNVTDAADELIGTAENTTTGADPVTSSSKVRGVITIASSKVFELRHRCGTTNSGDGFGKAANVGVAEVYASIFIRKLA